MIKISVKNISITVLLSFLFFFVVSCGGGTGTIEGVSIQPTYSGGFQQWKSEVSLMTPAEFVTWWNNTERYNGWKFSYYGQNGLVWPDSSGAEQIFTSKLLNCYRMTVLLQVIFGGEIVYVTQPGSQYDHCYLKLKDGKIDNCGLILKFLKE